MALNPNIPLSLAQQENPLMGLSRGIESGMNLARQAEALELARAQEQRETTEATRQAQLADLQRLQPLISQVQQHSADLGQRATFARQLIQNLGLTNLPPDLTDDINDFSDESLNALSAGLSQLSTDKRFQAGASFTAEVDGRPVIGMGVFDPSKGTVQPVLTPLPEGAQFTGGQFDLTPQQERQRQLSLERELQGVRLQTEPEIASRMEAAKRATNIAVDSIQTARSNEKGLMVWNIASNNLVDAIGENVFLQGPILGQVRAFTASAQQVDMAAAAMEPALKSTFRQSGEGTYTDGDRAALLALVPDRTTAPEAVGRQMQLLDQLVKAKLQGDARPVDEIYQNITGQPLSSQILQRKTQLLDQINRGQEPSIFNLTTGDTIEQRPPEISADMWQNMFTEQDRRDYLDATRRAQQRR